MLSIVKLQSQVQTSVLELGVDFVLPLSQQQQEQQQEEEEPHVTRTTTTNFVPKIIFGPKTFFQPKMFLDSNFLGVTQFFSDQIFFLAQNELQ